MEGSSNYDWDNHNRRIIMEGRQVLERTGASLARSNQVAIETEQIGNEVLSELDQQREVLLRTSDRLQNANEGLKKSNALLRSMSRNIIYNRLILILIILMEIIILSSLIYIKFIKKK